MSKPMAVYCADIGSVATKHFGWYGKRESGPPIEGKAMECLAAAVAEDLNKDLPVALGFECPLFVPISQDPERLTKARVCDGNRSWSAFAGCGALTTGLVQVVWLLREIRKMTGGTKRAFLDWREFNVNAPGLFIWEAFVSGGAKRESHAADAKAAVKAFSDALLNGMPEPPVRPGDETYSLIGAALLRTKWATDPNLLEYPCIVIRP